jgi:type IV secretion system protein VirB5
MAIHRCNGLADTPATIRVMKDLNPYVEARREWSDRYLDLVRMRRSWQLTAIAELALVGVPRGRLHASGGRGGRR